MHRLITDIFILAQNGHSHKNSTAVLIIRCRLLAPEWIGRCCQEETIPRNGIKSLPKLSFIPLGSGVRRPSNAERPDGRWDAPASGVRACFSGGQDNAESGSSEPSDRGQRQGVVESLYVGLYEHFTEYAAAI